MVKKNIIILLYVKGCVKGNGSLCKNKIVGIFIHTEKKKHEKLSKDQKPKYKRNSLQTQSCIRLCEGPGCLFVVPLLSWEIKTFLFSLQMSILGAARCAKRGDGGGFSPLRLN